MSVRFLHGDCRDVLRTLPDESVDCVVTSPPYWGLRDYGTAKWEGGDSECQHKVRNNARVQSSTLGGGKLTTGHSREGFANSCPRCGAKRIDSQIGLEPTPDEYVAQMVVVFREVRRVLRKDGTLWLNLGDSYASNWPCNRRNVIGQGPLENGKREARPARMGEGLKDKDLVGIPWRVAFALQADGWYLRQDIIWSKPNPMPESVRDRCTKAHEYLFLLSKSQRYFYDSDEISEAANPDNYRSNPSLRSIAPGQTRQSKPDSRRGEVACETRNKRSVWTVPTQPLSEAHFATFPPALIEPCILAGCPKGGTVLDPFGGAGTVGLVADRLRRDAILIELNPAYVEMAERRVKSDAPLFAQTQVTA